MNKASEASHQADIFAELWFEHLSMLELIAKNLGAVEKQKTIVALGIVQLRDVVATETAFAPAR